MEMMNKQYYMLLVAALMAVSVLLVYLLRRYAERPAQKTAPPAAK